MAAAAVCLGGIASIAQVPDTQTQQNRQAESEASLPAASHWAEQVVLGSSTVELNGPWKFHKGDNLAWAQPEFNDAGWSAMDLTPPPGSYDPFLGTTDSCRAGRCWATAGYSGYAWYRLKVNVQYDPGLSEGGLEIKMPDDVDDAYQVFVDGQMIGELGHFSGKSVKTYLTLPRTFAVPSGIKSGQITIAIRVWMDPSTLLTNPDVGGLHGPPVLGQKGPIERMLRLDWAL